RGRHAPEAAAARREARSIERRPGRIRQPAFALDGQRDGWTPDADRVDGTRRARPVAGRLGRGRSVAHSRSLRGLGAARGTCPEGPELPERPGTEARAGAAHSGRGILTLARNAPASGCRAALRGRRSAFGPV